MGAICKLSRPTANHRLSAIRNAHRIIVMDKGRIVEAGPHDALLQLPKGLYAHLWRLQQMQQAAANTPQPAPPKTEVGA